MFGSRGSLCTDVDSVFGSRGSLLTLGALPCRQPRTLLLANPPYVPEVLDALAPKLTALISRAEPGAIALCVVPALGGRTEQEAPHCAALRDSPVTRGIIELPAGDHSFCSGIAHRQTFDAQPRRVSRHATSVYVMASSTEHWTAGMRMEARGQPPDADGNDGQAFAHLLDAVRAAFSAAGTNKIAGHYSRRSASARRKARRGSSATAS